MTREEKIVLEEVQNVRHKLDSWDNDFLDNLQEIRLRDGKLSPRQHNKLTVICKRHCSPEYQLLGILPEDEKPPTPDVPGQTKMNFPPPVPPSKSDKKPDYPYRHWLVGKIVEGSLDEGVVPADAGKYARGVVELADEIIKCLNAPTSKPPEK